MNDGVQYPVFAWTLDGTGKMLYVEVFAVEVCFRERKHHAKATMSNINGHSHPAR